MGWEGEMGEGVGGGLGEDAVGEGAEGEGGGHGGCCVGEGHC